MNTIVLQLALLFLPGIIWERIHATYALKDKPEQFDIIRRAFVFGVISYALAFAAYSGLHRRFYIVTLDGDHIAFSIKIAREIAYATLIAFVMALAHLAFDSGKFFSKFVRRARLTDRYGTEDIWDYTLSRKDPMFGYLHLRDFEKKIIYSGYVELYSESEKLRELVLRDAIVYSFDREELFRAPRVYISRDKDNIDIEFPEIPLAASPTVPQGTTTTNEGP